MQAKANLRVTTEDEDPLIAGLIVSARTYVEGQTGLVLTQRTLTETTAELGRWIELQSWPVTAVTAIRYPVAGVMTDLADGSWQTNFNRRPVRLLPATWGWGLTGGYRLPDRPSLPVEIDVSAGYASPADVPAPIKQAMHLLIGHWYGNRSAVESGLRAAAIEVPMGVDSLLAPYRSWRV